MEAVVGSFAYDFPHFFTFVNMSKILGHFGNHLFVLRSCVPPVDVVRNPLDIIEKVTRDEMRHATQRMCQSS